MLGPPFSFISSTMHGPPTRTQSTKNLKKRGKTVQIDFVSGFDQVVKLISGREGDALSQVRSRSFFSRNM